MDNGISFTSMADGECLSFMRTRHIYALFSNALDNAVEAVMRVSSPEKRVISLHIRRLSSAVEIAVMNYYEGEIKFKNDLPQTIKTDGRRHDENLHQGQRLPAGNPAEHPGKGGKNEGKLKKAGDLPAFLVLHGLLGEEQLWGAPDKMLLCIRGKSILPNRLLLHLNLPVQTSACRGRRLLHPAVLRSASVLFWQ